MGAAVSRGVASRRAIGLAKTPTPSTTTTPTNTTTEAVGHVGATSQHAVDTTSSTHSTTSSGGSTGAEDAELEAADRHAAQLLSRVPPTHAAATRAAAAAARSASAQHTLDQLRAARARREAADAAAAVRNGLQRTTIDVRELVVLLRSRPAGAPTTEDAMDAMRETADAWQVTHVPLGALAAYFSAPEPIGRVDPTSGAQHAPWR